MLMRTQTGWLGVNKSLCFSSSVSVCLAGFTDRLSLALSLCNPARPPSLPRLTRWRASMWWGGQAPPAKVSRLEWCRRSKTRSSPVWPGCRARRADRPRGASGSRSTETSSQTCLSPAGRDFPATEEGAWKRRRRAEPRRGGARAWLGLRRRRRGPTSSVFSSAMLTEGQQSQLQLNI